MVGCEIVAHQAHMHSKTKGDIGQAAIIKDLLTRGFEVFVEFGDNSKVDLILHKDKKCVRVQVKAITSTNGFVPVVSYKSGPNYQFAYKVDDVDVFAFYVLDKDLIFYMSSKELVGKHQHNIRISKPKANTANKNKPCRFIEEYFEMPS